MIKQRSTSFKTVYEWADEFTNRQWRKFWDAKDYNMADDMHSFRTVLTKPERLMLIEILKIFNLYEVNIGIEFWNGRFKKMFPRYEFERMGAVFGAIETGVHAPFYIQMSDALGFNTEEFHDAPYNDPVLKERLATIIHYLKGECDIRCLAAMCLLEGTALFSSIAALVSFRAPGSPNAMTNMVSGIIHSAEDEWGHSMASAKCFQVLVEESNLSNEELAQLEKDVREMTDSMVEHEDRITDNIFKGGDNRFIAKEDLKIFSKHRGNRCLEMLGYEQEDVKHNPIGEWFYILVDAYGFHDFFQQTGSEYTKSVNKSRFTW